ncbi:hypothetical protein B0E48_12675 [Rhodanobacter sp. C03]|nr:hypothetical protein B0E48_12675 [Rhodanobacter sp. C03]
MLALLALLTTCTFGVASPVPSPPAADASADSRPQAYQDRNFDYFVTGDPRLPRAAHTETGFALMGGGGSVDAAFEFIARRAGGGHIVILRADDSFDPHNGNYGEQFATQWGPVVSAETIVFHNRQASFDPRVLAALRGADGIFLAGGDQAHYINYWKGTPVQDALNEHVRLHRPIGGSSAGLAILGHYSYTALAGGSMESSAALADPYNAEMSLESDFLHYPQLAHVVIDTHFSRRSRLGRLITFVARFNQEFPAGRIFGVGIDEHTALLVDQDGSGRIAPGSLGSAWLVLPQRPATTLTAGQPLSIDDVRIVRVDAAGSVNLLTGNVEHPTAETTISIHRGKPTRASPVSPIMQRKLVPPNEG